MVVLNTSMVIGYVINNIAEHILGSTTMTGLWILVVLFGVMTAFNIRFAITVVLLMPITIVMLAYGYVEPIAGAVIILLSGIIAAFNFFNK